MGMARVLARLPCAPEPGRVSMTDVLPLPCATEAATTGGGGLACTREVRS